VQKWLVRDGESVAKGMPVVEIETEKAVFEIEAEFSGVLHVGVAEGQRVPVGTCLGLIASPEAAVDAIVGKDVEVVVGSAAAMMPPSPCATDLAGDYAAVNYSDALLGSD